MRRDATSCELPAGGSNDFRGRHNEPYIFRYEWNGDSGAGQADIADIEFREFTLMAISCSGLKRTTAGEQTVEWIDEVTDSVLKLFN
jgi:hypothetical protein